MPWELADLLVELLDFSYRMLRPGGRLVGRFSVQDNQAR